MSYPKNRYQDQYHGVFLLYPRTYKAPDTECVCVRTLSLSSILIVWVGACACRHTGKPRQDWSQGLSQARSLPSELSWLASELSGSTLSLPPSAKVIGTQIYALLFIWMGEFKLKSSSPHSTGKMLLPAKLSPQLSGLTSKF